MPRRERASIYGDLLETIDAQARTFGGEARITNVAIAANVPYDRMRLYLRALVEAGLVTDERMPRLTERGQELLTRYRQWHELLRRFGLDGANGAASVPPERQGQAASSAPASANQASW